MSSGTLDYAGWQIVTDGSFPFSKRGSPRVISNYLAMAIKVGGK
jgi:hypothetical protein